MRSLGTPPRVLGHAQDITERVRAEEALKESERRFRSMADTAPVFIWMPIPGPVRIRE
jgi:PAS domain-containing protein